MKITQTLQGRIMIAFALLAALLCGAFALTNYVVIHRLESNLYYDHLQQFAEWLVDADRPISFTDLPEDIQLYVADGPDLSALPAFLQTLDADKAEVVFGDKAYHVIVLTKGAKRYYLVQDQSKFERFEKAIEQSILLGFFIVVLAAIVLGRITANRVIAPAIRLADQVKDATSSNALVGLAPDEYADDEIGLLARRLFEFAQGFQAFLDRERLFTGDVSHELRTPLMVITSSCELLLAKSDQSKEQAQAIQRIYAAAREMRSLVDTFLRLSREGSASEKEMRDCSANQVIAEELEMFANRAPSDTQPEIHFQQDAELTVFGVPQLLRVVIRNLLGNALHYTKTGTVTVTVSVRPGAIVFDDTGVGIPDGLGEAIFERHFQGANTAAIAGGQGLGLSIVKRICDYHGWRIRHEPRRPAGSRFTVDVSHAA